LNGREGKNLRQFPAGMADSLQDIDINKKLSEFYNLPSGDNRRSPLPVSRSAHLPKCVPPDVLSNVRVFRMCTP
jgi:hypothetical protein